MKEGDWDSEGSGIRKKEISEPWIHWKKAEPLRFYIENNHLDSAHIQKQDLSTSKFPIQKWMIFYKFKEIKELRGGVQLYAAQTTPQIDEEIVKKGHFWMETR